MQIAKFTFNLFQENTFVLYTASGHCAIIDAGCSNSQENKTLSQFIEENKLNPKYLLNTHCHIDHVLGNSYVYSKWGLKPLMHADDVETLEEAVRFAQLYGQNIEDTPRPEEFLKEGDELMLDDEKLEIFFTPGHASGHITFVSHKHRFIISGDVLFFRSIGRTDLPRGNFEVLKNSIHQKLFTLPDDYTVYCGHGPETSIGEEKIHNPFVGLG